MISLQERAQNVVDAFVSGQDTADDLLALIRFALSGAAIDAYENAIGIVKNHPGTSGIIAELRLEQQETAAGDEVEE